MSRQTLGTIGVVLAIILCVYLASVWLFSVINVADRMADCPSHRGEIAAWSLGTKFKCVSSSK